MCQNLFSLQGPSSCPTAVPKTRGVLPVQRSGAGAHGRIDKFLPHLVIPLVMKAFPHAMALTPRFAASRRESPVFDAQFPVPQCGIKRNYEPKQIG